MQTTSKGNTSTDHLFLCEDGNQHRIGQNAHDSGHGVRPVGPQICLRCRRTLSELIYKVGLQKQIEILDKSNGENSSDLIHDLEEQLEMLP